MPGSARRAPYRRDFTDRLAAIEARRQRAGVTIKDLCERAGVADATYRRMRRARMAFERQVNALSMALRSIERDRRTAAALFPDVEA